VTTREQRLEAALRECQQQVGDDGLPCWCCIPSMVPYRGHDSGCLLARAALVEAPAPPVEGLDPSPECKCRRAGVAYAPWWVPIHTPDACWLQSGEARIELAGDVDGRPLPPWAGAPSVEEPRAECLICDLPTEVLQSALHPGEHALCREHFQPFPPVEEPDDQGGTYGGGFAAPPVERPKPHPSHVYVETSNPFTAMCSRCKVLEGDPAEFKPCPAPPVEEGTRPVCRIRHCGQDEGHPGPHRAPSSEAPARPCPRPHHLLRESEKCPTCSSAPGTTEDAP
jgi:hypothetical protein